MDQNPIEQLRALRRRRELEAAQQAATRTGDTQELPAYADRSPRRRRRPLVAGLAGLAVVGAALAVTIPALADDGAGRSAGAAASSTSLRSGGGDTPTAPATENPTDDPSVDPSAPASPQQDEDGTACAKPPAPPAGDRPEPPKPPKSPKSGKKPQPPAGAPGSADRPEPPKAGDKGPKPPKAGDQAPEAPQPPQADGDRPEPPAAPDTES